MAQGPCLFGVFRLVFIAPCDFERAHRTAITFEQAPGPGADRQHRNAPVACDADQLQFVGGAADVFFVNPFQLGAFTVNGAIEFGVGIDIADLRVVRRRSAWNLEQIDTVQVGPARRARRRDAARCAARQGYGNHIERKQLLASDLVFQLV